MKKLYILFIATLLSADLAVAQSEDRITGVTKPASLNNITSLTPWQLLYNYDITTAGANFQNAGVILFGNEYWVSKFNSDTMYTLDMTGAVTSTFFISGVSSIRSMTTDGTMIYAGANAGQIIVIDPVTKTVGSVINTPTVPAVRWCTYDATADGGNGGFWVGNYGTDMDLVNSAGTVINSIAATTHLLTASYGVACDNSTPGGPYLWSFHQTDTAVTAGELRQISIATGMQTGIVHDVSSEIGYHANPAGGVFFSPPSTLIGLLQGDVNTHNRVFAYDVNLVGIAENAASPDFVNAYPNPVKDVVNIGVKRTNNDPMTMKIIDTNGKIVYETDDIAVSNIFNFSKYPAGVYTVLVYHNGTMHSTRIVRN